MKNNSMHILQTLQVNFELVYHTSRIMPIAVDEDRFCDIICNIKQNFF